jgi:hypothetical protein
MCLTPNIVAAKAPKPSRRKKPDLLAGLPTRIVSARLPRKRHYGEIRYGVPDEAERTLLIRQFMERTLKGERATSRHPKTISRGCV